MGKKLLSLLQASSLTLRQGLFESYYFKSYSWAGDVVPLVECLSSMQEALGSIRSTTNLGEMIKTNANTWEGEVQGSEVQGYPWQNSEFQASLNYMNPYLKKQTKGQDQIPKWHEHD